MKSINRKSLLAAGLCAVAITFGTTAYAEKGAERLLSLARASATVSTQPSTPDAHSCMKCTDTQATVVDKATKGPNHATSQTVRHDCATCDTKITTEGVGKAKRDTATHSCNAEVKPACCAKK